MTYDSEILQLLERWEERRDRGETLTPEDLCRDCPQRVEDVRRAIGALGDLGTMLGDGAPEPTTGHDAGDGESPVPAAAFAGLRYRPVRFHRRGGQGEVYVARDEELNRDIALKRIQPRLGGSATAVRRFLSEAEVTGRLEHPGVVPVYGLGRDADGQPYYAMRFIEGESLQEALRRYHQADAGAPALAFRQLLGQFVALCNTVAYAHSRGIVHRDIKPSNTMLGKYGETFVVDWGLATPIDRQDGPPVAMAAAPPDAGDRTGTGQAVGTPVYMSPEQAAGARVGPASDIYSLGVTLYELLTGRVPFGTGNALLLQEAIQRASFPWPRQVKPGVPAALEAVCLKAMALKPADRYASALELAGEVERWLADEPVAAYREPLGARLRRWVRKHARLVTGLAAALVVGLAALGVVTWQSERSRWTLTNEQAKTANQRDRALVARTRTREALDAVTSSAALEALTAKAELSPEQRGFLDNLLKYYEEFAGDSAEDPSGRPRLAAASLRVGRLREALGVPGAEAAFAVAVARYRTLAAEGPSEPSHREGLSLAAGALGHCLYEQGKSGQAEPHVREALALCAARAAERPGDRLAAREHAHALTNLATIVWYSNRAEAEVLTRQSLAILWRLDDGSPTDRPIRAQAATGTYNLAVLLQGQGKLPEAEASYREALAAWATLAAESPATTRYRRGAFLTRAKFGRLLVGQRRWPEAVAELHAGRALGERLAGDYPAIPEYAAHLGNCYECLGVAAIKQGDAAAAYDWFVRAVKVVEPIAATGRSLLVAETFYGGLHGAAVAAEHLGRHREAADYLGRLRGLDPHGDDADVGVRRAVALARAGDRAMAVEEAAALAAMKGATADTLYSAACVFALVGGATKDDDALAARYAHRSVELLRGAVVAGYRDIPRMLTVADLDPLRRRPDFADLLWDLSDSPAPVKR